MITTTHRDLIDSAMAEINTLSVAAARDLLAGGGARFIDLRDQRELKREGIIPGAFHCPRGMLEFWIDPTSPYFKPVFAEPVTFVFFCASAWRSALATKTAQDMGLAPVAHIEGGFSAWRSAGCPVATLDAV